MDSLASGSSGIGLLPGLAGGTPHDRRSRRAGSGGYDRFRDRVRKEWSYRHMRADGGDVRLD